jgi:hypothetical protein
LKEKAGKNVGENDTRTHGATISTFAKVHLQNANLNEEATTDLILRPFF